MISTILRVALKKLDHSFISIVMFFIFFL